MCVTINIYYSSAHSKLSRLIYEIYSLKMKFQEHFYKLRDGYFLAYREGDGLALKRIGLRYTFCQSFGVCHNDWFMYPAS